QRRPAVSPEDAAMLRDRVLYRDDWIIALDKPAGLAVQGGEKTARHIDGMLDALRFGAAERPRLVHRLDRDTSGVLVLARNARAAREIAAGFRGKDVTKLYWAAVVGVPREARGIVDLALAKRAGAARAGGEAMVADAEGGQRAVTAYRVVDQTGNRAAWLALWPRTGRTHQLRVHCAAIGTPILGDGKYGGADAHLGGEGISDRLHLHARRLVMPHPGGSGVFDVTAPLPEHMRQTWKALGFDPKQRAADDTDNPWSEDPRRGRRRNE
ncbi:MAG: RluA family pseudouridine synthase, partial [Inquilinus sp.]|nr:RluA family pseudouridine synthase [Inquilinus sp.]